jgi:predicted 3-demethylubiquinone-9 3-methyltransferase (glyoxalase superfamily)
MQKITPFLWFDNQAEEATNLYVSIFKNSKVVRVTRNGPEPKDSVMSTTFQLDGQEFYALNGGPLFTFTPAISFFIHCETQAEIDEFWEKLSAGGTQERCGWLKDKFGVSWQVVPSDSGEAVTESRSRKKQARDGGHAANEQARYQRVTASRRGCLVVWESCFRNLLISAGGMR